jgi:hypothetical protein
VNDVAQFLKSLVISIVGEDTARGTCLQGCWEGKLGKKHLKKNTRLSIKSEQMPSHDPEILASNVNRNSGTRTIHMTRVFIAVLFVITPHWKQLDFYSAR